MSGAHSARVSGVRGGGHNSKSRAEILAGLRETPPRLPSHFLYDERGAELFEEITRTAAYYPTRCEIEILRRHAQRLSAWMGPAARIVEFGTGSGLKSRLLLDSAQEPATYIPVDVAGPQLQAVAEELRLRYPGLDVLPVCADYTQPLRLPEARAREQRVVIFFPGSTIGNMDPDDAVGFLKRVASIAGPDGLLIVGVDCKKDRRTLDLAYNDPDGVTAEFNLNILAHVNRITGSDFEASAFRHRAFYNEAEGRVEMHVVSAVEQTVHVPDPGRAELRMELRAGDAIVTEYSYKYTVAEFQAMAREAGYTVADALTDDGEKFAVHVLRG